MTRAVTRVSWATICLLACAAQPTLAQTHPSAPPSQATTDAEAARSSYALGFAEGSSVLREYKLRAKIDATSAAAGFKAAIEGSAPRYPREEMTRALRPFQTMGWVDPGEVAAVQQAGSEYLAKNRKAPGVVQLSTGVQYRIITPGQGPRPTLRDAIKIAFHRKLTDGAEFDASPGNGGPITIPVARTMRSWRQVLPLMGAGSRVEIVVPPGQEFEASAATRPVPPHAVVICDVELLEVVPSTSPGGPQTQPKTSPSPSPKAK